MDGYNENLKGFFINSGFTNAFFFLQYAEASLFFNKKKKGLQVSTRKYDILNII